MSERFNCGVPTVAALVGLTLLNACGGGSNSNHDRALPQLSQATGATHVVMQ